MLKNPKCGIPSAESSISEDLKVVITQFIDSYNKMSTSKLGGKLSG